MTAFVFAPLEPPFPRWMGPFSPARGDRSGFRFNEGRLGTWVGHEAGSAFWPVVESPGARTLAALVKQHWRGGRVLLLPNGFVVKPLRDEEVGRRVLIGRFAGSIVLERRDQPRFDLSQPGNLKSGDRWLGPATTGLECAIQSDGSLLCSWYHPTSVGRDEVTRPLRGPDRSLFTAFRAARPGATGGRVRLTANGHVITNRQESSGSWVCLYVDYVDPRQWNDWEQWIEKE